MVRGKRLTNSKIQKKVCSDEKNDPMSTWYKAFLFILVLAMPSVLYIVRFVHFFIGPDDIYEQVGNCRFGFISLWKPKVGRSWSVSIAFITFFHYTVGLILFYKIVKIKRE